MQGACLNDVPVVARFPEGQTIREALAQIRNQHAESSKHETLGFKRILGECKPSDWPANARMTSSVQYRGFIQEEPFHMGDAKCTMSLVERSMDLEDLTVVVEPLEGSAFNVEFLFSDHVVGEDQARKWFKELMHALSAFSDGSS